MYAIVDIAGQQFKVEKDKKIFVHRLEGEEGSEVEFDKVLLVDNDGTVKIGEPHITGALVTAKILQHDKGDKVLVFKKKRRKGYQKMNGHRQYLTQLLIENIVAEGGTKKAAPAKKAAPRAEVKESVAEEAPKAEKKAPAKKAAPKKAAPKKEASAAPKKETKAATSKETTKKAAPKKAAEPKKDEEAKSQSGAADKKEDKSE